ncbi:MAG: aspartate aminotransferase family protein [Ignavibacteria bacterium]|jgi:acetylornithine/N-succinyldiaminopimelate aminotransferase
MKDTLIEREHEVMFQNYRRLPIEIERAIGTEIFDTSGKRYLDFLSGIAVNALGHSHPRIIKAIQQQAEQYLHVSNFFYQEPQIRLSELIKEKSGMDRVYFSNSGAESFEGAIKLARLWGNEHGKHHMIAFEGGFHGRTYGALSLMNKPLYKDGMGPFLPNMSVIPFNDVEALTQSVNQDTCAVALEFLQGEGGITHAEPAFITALMNLKEQFNFLLIADEVQSGVGRTGSLFFFDKYLIKPDIIVMAKGIGGGLPLGAIVTTNDLAKLVDKGRHGTTYGGNSLACAAGIVVMEELYAGVMANAREMGCYLKDTLHAVKDEFPDLVKEIRGCGCMQGAVLSFESAILVEELLKNGIIANSTAVKVLRVLPPLTISKKDVDEFGEKLRTSLQNLASKGIPKG